MNRKAFFDIIRYSIFNGKIPEKSVKGIEGILDAWEDTGETDQRQLACCLGHTWLEVGRNMYPVREGFATTDQQAMSHVSKMFARGQIRRNYAIPDASTGLSAFGRGQIQLTWIENYIKAGQKLGLDLVNNPDMLLDPKISGQVVVRGCLEGWFRGDKGGRQKLSRFFNDRTANWKGARNIVNGDKRGGELEYVGKLFFNALHRSAGEEPTPPQPKGTTIMNTIIMSILRHVLTALGGGIVAKGYIDGAMLEQIIGGVLAIAGQAMSLVEKNERKA